MTRTLLIFLSILLGGSLFAGCAAKTETFDAAAVFAKAEQQMQDGQYEKARMTYQEIQEKEPDKSFDAALMLRIADTYFGEEKFEEALVEYRSFLNYHPVHRDAAYAQYQVALCSYNQMSTIDRDPALTRAALKEFKELLKTYPGSEYAERARDAILICTDRLAQYEFYVARFYEKKGAYRSAAGRLEALLSDYPRSTVEREAMLLAGSVYRELGEREKARSVLERLSRTYPSVADDAASLLKKLEVSP